MRRAHFREAFGKASAELTTATDYRELEDAVWTANENEYTQDASPTDEAHIRGIVAAYRLGEIALDRVAHTQRPAVEERTLNDKIVNDSRDWLASKCEDIRGVRDWGQLRLDQMSCIPAALGHLLFARQEALQGITTASVHRLHQTEDNLNLARIFMEGGHAPAAMFYDLFTTAARIEAVLNHHIKQSMWQQKAALIYDQHDPAMLALHNARAGGVYDQQSARDSILAQP